MVSSYVPNTQTIKENNSDSKQEKIIGVLFLSNGEKWISYQPPTIHASYVLDII